MNYVVLAREIQKLVYAAPEKCWDTDPEGAKAYVESFVQHIEEKQSSSRFEELVQEHDMSED